MSSTRGAVNCKQTHTHTRTWMVKVVLVALGTLKVLTFEILVEGILREDHGPWNVQGLDNLAITTR